MAAEISRYSLEAAYKGVERDALDRTQAQEQPRAILLGGQPGSGKAELAAGAVRELRQHGGAVLVDADRMREENPRYKQLSIEDPQHAADRTQAEAGQWATRLTLAAAENRRNVVIDGTMRGPENIRELAERLRENGYRVEARVMAVDAETSMTRARLRYEEQVDARGTGRFVNQAQHDAAYAGVPRTVDLLERERLVDRLTLHDAHHRPVYDNVLEQGQWKAPPAAARTLEQERSREWTYAERKDYVAALEEITTLAMRREQGRNHVTYTVGSAASPETKTFTDAHGAARAFHEANAEHRPYVIRTERTSGGIDGASMVASTMVVAKGDDRQFAKSVGGDAALQRAYADVSRSEQEQSARAMPRDSADLAAKLADARAALASYEQSPGFQRAAALESLPKSEALARHPELDGAYKQLHELKQGWTPQTTQDEREATYFAARAALAEQLRAGAVPSANVTHQESRRVIDMAASHRGLMVRDSAELQRDVRGEVAAASSHHVLVKLSEDVAVRFDRAALDRQVSSGDRVAIQYGQPLSTVHEQGQEPRREPAREMSHDLQR